MAAVQTYSHGTLNNNWAEDRQQPAEALAATGLTRFTRSYESDIAYIGDRYDVLNRISRMPPRVSYATPDDGFRERDCTSQLDFIPPATRKEFVAKPPAFPWLITTESVPEVSHDERRPIPGNKRGFGAVLQRHEETHEQRFFATTTAHFYGEGGPRSARGPLCSKTVVNPEALRPAGVSTEHEENRQQGVKVGCLCGEKYSEAMDPALDSKTQRAWLYQADPSLSNVHLGGQRRNKVKGGVDNALSLPLGDGAMSKIRNDLKDRQGRLYRTATHITKGMSKRPGVCVFEDG
jgi:hypothetical protein